MKILLINARNDTSVTHSRKGMYVPLGLLSIATYAEQRFGDAIAIDIVDEDVETLNTDRLAGYGLVGFYATTFNYRQSLGYAAMAKAAGARTVFGGPHPTALAANVARNPSVDFVVDGEGETGFAGLIQHLMSGDDSLRAIPNLVFDAGDGNVVRNLPGAPNDLSRLPIPSRKFVPVDRYIANYRKAYPRYSEFRHGSIITSKGCVWRDKTNGGCVFCARHDEGIRFRPIDQLWEEIRYLKENHGVNYIWDAADDSLNDAEWFMRFVEARPRDLEDIRFFIYSRVTPVRPGIIEYFKRLNVDEVYLGVESADTTVLKNTVKGQSIKSIRRALHLIAEGGMRFFPSFVLGLPGENAQSLKATYDLCREIVDMGAFDRASATILMPIPGSPAFAKVRERLNDQGASIDDADHVDLPRLERYWADNFTEIGYDGLVEYKARIDEVLASRANTFGTAVA